MELFIIPVDLEIKMKKNDWVLIFLVLFVGLFSYGIVKIVQIQSTKEPQAVITQEGKLVATYPLWENQLIYIPTKENWTNCLKIENGVIYMLEANCPDKICVNHKPISKNGESIVCLPNKVVVIIENGIEQEVDGGTY